LVSRERSDGLYKAVTYLVAKLLEEVIVALVQSLIMSCIVFFPLELAGSWALFWYTYFQTTVIGICTLPPHPFWRAFW
jgi:ATP-binding cassette subfamily G (WHITE) protein 2